MFGVTVYTGHRQVSSAGQEKLIVIGLQGKEVPFKDLPLLNLAFVIDKSGSRGIADKMSWVKESFEIFIEAGTGPGFCAPGGVRLGCQSHFPINPD